MATGMDTPRRVKMGEPTTYVYCAVRAGRRPTLKRGVRGLPAAGPPRLLDVGEPKLWLVVATVPAEEYGAAPIERRLKDLEWVSRCAIGHERVVEDAARSGPVVPMKLFTLFSSDERAVAHVGRARKKLARLFDLVAGREEWGVRVSVDERLAVRRRVQEAGPAKAASGTSFLLRKKAENHAARSVIEEAIGEGERIFGELAGSAVDARRRTPAQSDTAIRVVLDAAFLVPATRARTFKKAVAALTKSRRGEEYDVTLTGPWPPYNFVSEPA
jgi:hypothetical protein